MRVLLEIGEAENPYEVARLNSSYVNLPVRCHAAGDQRGTDGDPAPYVQPSILPFFGSRGCHARTGDASPCALLYAVPVCPKFLPGPISVLIHHVAPSQA